ncbi:phospholipase-like protein [Tanacetum coccineum]
MGHSSMTNSNCDRKSIVMSDYFENEYKIDDYLVEEELRLCLEAEERMRLEHEKNIIEELSFMVKEAKRMKLEEEKLLQISHMPGKSKATVSWVKINKHRLNVNDPSLAELLRKVKPWVEDLSRSFHSLDTVWLTPDIQRFISREGNIKCKFPWSDDYTVGRNFWLTLVCLDPTRKGWLSEEHIDLWVDYMWHGRPDNANWAMVSCYFVQILLQNSTPLFYANGDKYATPWSDVDQVFFPINETAQHWCLAHFDIVSGLVTFYDSGDTYDYESRDFYVRVRECLKFIIATYANSGDDKEMMIKLFEIDNERDFRTVRDTYASCQVLNLRCQERREQMIKMQPFLHLSPVLAESYNLLKVLQDYELEKCRDLMKSISKTQLKVLKKISFMAKLSRTPSSVWFLREMVKSENKKLLDLKKHLVDAEEDIRVKEKWFVVILLLNCNYGFVGRNMTDDMHVLDEVVFKIHKNGYFELDPLSILENKQVLFYCLPNKSLEKGLKLIHTDNDVHSFFADAERRGLWKKKLKGEEKMVDDEPLGRKLLKTSRKGKEKMDEFPDSTPIKERKYSDDRVGRNSIRTRHKGKEIMVEFSDTPANEKKVVFTNYRRAIINGKAKMVEVADVGLVEDELNLLNKKDLRKKPVRSSIDVQESNVKADYNTPKITTTQRNTTWGATS